KSQQQLGLYFFLNRKMDRAELFYEKAGSGWDQLARSMAPAEFEEHRANAAECHSHLGELYSRNGKYAPAEAAYRKAIGLHEGSAKGRKDPGNPAIELGGCCCNLGLVLLAQEKAKEALEWFDRAASTLEPVRKKTPEDPTATTYFRNCLRGRAQTLT